MKGTTDYFQRAGVIAILISSLVGSTMNGVAHATLPGGREARTVASERRAAATQSDPSRPYSSRLRDRKLVRPFVRLGGGVIGAIGKTVDATIDFGIASAKNKGVAIGWASIGSAATMLYALNSYGNMPGPASFLLGIGKDLAGNFLGNVVVPGVMTVVIAGSVIPKLMKRYPKLKTTGRKILGALELLPYFRSNRGRAGGSELQITGREQRLNFVIDRFLDTELRAEFSPAWAEIQEQWRAHFPREQTQGREPIIDMWEYDQRKPDPFLDADLPDDGEELKDVLFLKLGLRLNPNEVELEWQRKAPSLFRPLMVELVLSGSAIDRVRELYRSTPESKSVTVGEPNVGVEKP